ncbi:chemotaxis protein CheA [Paenibacillus chartarius]|uniref:Chemotaxis protein CheA n=1 Tax=Paenibacillus chartarius TaxID=747481 RepID=A0ABV6DPL0_9BACL
MSDNHMSQYLSLFLQDMEEHLQLLEDALLKLEKQGNGPELIPVMFRAAHSLKGSSAAMGFEHVTLLTHRMEDVLDRIRSERLHIDRSVIDVLFRCLDVLTEMKIFISHGESTEHPMMKELTERLRWMMEQRPELPDALIADEQGSFSYTIHVTLHENAELKTARFYVMLNKLSEIGTVVRTSPDLSETLDQDPVQLQIVLESGHTAEEIEGHALKETDIACVSIEKSAGPAAGSANTEEAKVQAVPSAAHSSSVPSSDKKSSSIRIDVDRLEQLMNTLSELVIYQTRSVQITDDLSGKFRGDSVVSDLRENTSTMSKVISELQEHVIKTRMQPVDTLFNRLPRMVRDISQALSKDVEFIVEGGETELDRTVLEEIHDPLIHILRNALDHGIESQELREQRSKPAKATVSVRAVQQENHVILTVSDDGGGIDPERIKKSALDKGLISKQEADQLTPQQAIQLIFAPGFSTAKQVTDISGRGIGMDIVRSHIEKINGIIDIESEVGQGTRFHIRLPLTLAIIRGILFRLGERTFAMPMSNVLEIVKLDQRHIETAAGQEVFRYREQFIPIRWIMDDFDIPRNVHSGQETKLIVIGLSEKRFAIPVTELIGFQDIVIKPISDNVKKREIVSNATILGNGNVALILDAAGMYKTLSKGTVAPSLHS